MQPKLRNKFDEPLNSELQHILKKVEAVKEGKEGPPGSPGVQGPPGADAPTDEPLPLMYIDGIF